MKVDLTGKVAVVTGASSGIGAEITRQMAGAGAEVIAVGRHRERLDQVVEDANGMAGSAKAVIADLGDLESHGAVLEAARSAGGVDALILAAGQFAGTPFAETSVEELDDILAVHVRAPFVLTREMLPLLNKGSNVLFFSSTVAQVGFAPYAAYTAGKGAVEALSRSLAIELAPDIRVNTMVPGFTGTPMVFDQFPDAPGMEEAIIEKTPVGHLGGPESAASLAVILSSETGSYIDGARLVVDGGWSAQGWQP